MEGPSAEKMPLPYCLAYDTLWYLVWMPGTLLLLSARNQVPLPRISIPSCSEVCVCHHLQNPSVLRYMWAAESMSHICTRVAGVSGDASSPVLSWSSKILKVKNGQNIRRLCKAYCGSINDMYWLHRSSPGGQLVHTIRDIWVLEMFKLPWNKRELIYKSQLIKLYIVLPDYCKFGFYCNECRIKMT